MKKIGIVLSLVLVLQPLLLVADEIVKKDGEVLEDKIEKIEHNKYYRIRTKDGKLFQIKWEDVESVYIEPPREEKPKKNEEPMELEEKIKKDEYQKLQLEEYWIYCQLGLAGIFTGYNASTTIYGTSISDSESLGSRLGMKIDLGFQSTKELIGFSIGTIFPFWAGSFNNAWGGTTYVSTISY
jgi:hypothetical protein